ncbi:MAG: [FeFe] hydrogenase, group A [Candidatus Peregrinibacteria bacterium]
MSDLHRMAQAIEFDPKQCMGCTACVSTCQRLSVGYLEMCQESGKRHVAAKKDPKVDCIYCGQCTLVCPTGAICEQSEVAAVEALLKNKGDKVLIVQMAPSVRASIGELFDQEPGTNLMGQMVTALRQVGFDKVFDVNMGADITTVVEGEELVTRLKNKGILPMFTSCCPSWVKYVAFYHPELKPHLSTARSPQIHSGGAYKTWWAKREGVDPKKIVVVSLMPCTSKKQEARLEELKVNGMAPVDFVLTTREVATLFKNHQIDLPRLKPSDVDPCGTSSGAGAIYGASGGVMESVLRTAYFLLTGKELDKVEFEMVRGVSGLKKAIVAMGDYSLKIAVAHSIPNVKKVLEELKENPHAYDFVEVMVCPGGCMGGGGQPKPKAGTLEKRLQALYDIDASMTLRKAHQNPVVKEFLGQYIATLPREEQEAILHRSYS